MTYSEIVQNGSVVITVRYQQSEDGTCMFRASARDNGIIQWEDGLYKYGVSTLDDMYEKIWDIHEMKMQENVSS